ncbi:MAG: 2-amino-4-hydroxy-6-hydroxymethyldihydropteridine diphosphokinase [Limisphaerales bacterium]
MRPDLPPLLARVLAETPALRRAFLVGGCVRDALLGRPLKDFDVEVFGTGYDALLAALEPWGRADLVGRSFGVVKLTLPDGLVVDFSVPRRDSKAAPGHRGFTVTLDPGIAPRDAAARRDFTINTLMYDPRSGEVLDFFGGREDLERRVMRHTGPAFVEDPLRVLRGMQFAARFGLTAAEETLALCRTMRGSLAELAKERVRDEWFKWAARAERPSAGLRFLVDGGWLEDFPELAALRGTPQDPEWHPEGDVWTHTLHSLDALVTLPAWRDALETDRIVLSLAVLLHDVGKPVTTQREDRNGRGRIVSPRHEELGAEIAERFLGRLDAPVAVRERVLPLVRGHMARFEAPTDRAVRRLARRVAPETIERLCVVMTADAMGRPPLPAIEPATVRALRAKAEALQLREAAPRPVLLGRHLLGRGLTPGPELGRVLHEAFEAQLEGDFHDLDGALAWFEAHRRAPPPRVVVAVGANLGDPTAQVRAALDWLRGRAGGGFAASSLWRSTPAGCPPGSPPFINAVAVFAARPGETPESLLAAMQAHEHGAGRGPRRLLNAPRPVDLDLIAFGGLRRDSVELTLPHPRAHRRSFVLAPLAEIAPDLLLPGQKLTAGALLGELPEAGELLRLAG